MEQWQIEAIQALLETETKEVELGQRVYTSSSSYGSSRYHLIEKRYDGVQLEQIETDEKWSKRVNFYSDETAPLLKTLLVWHLEQIRQQQQQHPEGEIPDYVEDVQPF